MRPIMEGNAADHGSGGWQAGWQASTLNRTDSYRWPSVSPSAQVRISPATAQP